MEIFTAISFTCESNCSLGNASKAIPYSAAWIPDIVFAVNDDLTISYAKQTTDITGKGEDETNSGFGVSYSMGSMSVGAYAGKTENGNGVSTADDEGKGLTLSIAF